MPKNSKSLKKHLDFIVALSANTRYKGMNKLKDMRYEHLVRCLANVSITADYLDAIINGRNDVQCGKLGSLLKAYPGNRTVYSVLGFIGEYFMTPSSPIMLFPAGNGIRRMWWASSQNYTSTNITTSEPASIIITSQKELPVDIRKWPNKLISGYFHSLFLETAHSSGRTLRGHKNNLLNWESIKGNVEEIRRSNVSPSKFQLNLNNKKPEKRESTEAFLPPWYEQ